MHPQSISSIILPGNQVTVKADGTPTTKPRYTEIVYGYFWQLMDLRRCNEKPILSNETLIPDDIAKVFPTLKRLRSLTGQYINLPDYFLRHSRSDDATLRCTLVCVSFRDFGDRQLASWVEPFQKELSGNNDRVEVIRLILSEGWVNKWMLRPVIKFFVKRGTPVEEHDRTFLYFEGYSSGIGKTSIEPFRDAVRMHNVLPGYVFLVDSEGRVRFAGSGKGSDEEVRRLVKFAKYLTTPRRRTNNSPTTRSKSDQRHLSRTTRRF
jgi:ATPase complex subunit ATP10